jgi:curved DNA-binding protein
MANSVPFIDYYAVLQVNPNCSARALEAAYHFLAKMYHPDHAENPDVAKLTAVIEAYRVLKDVDQRADYNQDYVKYTGFIFSSSPEDEHDHERSAVSDADAHSKILKLLYKRRREHAREPGIGRFFVQEALNCSDDIFEFHLWYLREKGLIFTTEQGTVGITVDGIDHVISMSRTVLKESLRLTQSSESQAADRT